VRHAFSKAGGNLGTDGSVAYLFTKAGVIGFDAGCDEEQVMEVALEAGAEDVVTAEDGSIEVITTPEEFSAVKEALEAAALKPEYAEVTMRPSTTVSLGLEDAQKVLRLVEMLEDLDDVQQVYSNADIPAEVLEKMAG